MKNTAPLVAALMVGVAMASPVQAGGFKWQPAASSDYSEQAPSSARTVTKAKPGVAETAPVIQRVRYNAPVPNVSGARVLEGFADRVPLAVALRQILPSEYGFSLADGVDLGSLVSWKGGKPWTEVLANALAPVGLKASVRQDVVLIQKMSDATPAEAAAPAAPPPVAQPPMQISQAAPMTSAGAVPATQPLPMAPPPVMAQPGVAGTQMMGMPRGQVMAPAPRQMQAPVMVSPQYSQAQMMASPQPVPQPQMQAPQVIAPGQSQVQMQPQMAQPMMGQQMVMAQNYGMPMQVAPGYVMVPSNPYYSYPYAGAPAMGQQMMMQPQMQPQMQPPMQPQMQASVPMQVGQDMSYYAGQEMAAPLDPVPVGGGMDMGTEEMVAFADDDMTHAEDVTIKETWRAVRGSTLRTLLEKWSHRAGYELLWMAEYDYPVQASIVIDGDFEKAVRTVLAGFEKANPRPVGRLHNNSAAGHGVLVIEARGNDYGG